MEPIYHDSWEGNW